MGANRQTFTADWSGQREVLLVISGLWHSWGCLLWTSCWLLNEYTLYADCSLFAIEKLERGQSSLKVDQTIELDRVGMTMTCGWPAWVSAYLLLVFYHCLDHWQPVLHWQLTLESNYQVLHLNHLCGGSLQSLPNEDLWLCICSTHNCPTFSMVYSLSSFLPLEKNMLMGDAIRSFVECWLQKVRHRALD